MPAALDESQNLPAALDRLHDSVSRLVDDRKEQVQGRMLVRPSLYSDLVDAVVPRSASEASRAPSSTKMPVWAEPMELKWAVDEAVFAWNPDGATTPDRLRSFVSGRFRPQDSGRLTDIATRIEEFCVSITDLLEPAHIKEVTANCPVPECGARYVYRHSGGERIRQAALTITGSKLVCGACGVVYPEEQWLFVATKLMGREVPEGVLA